MSKHRDIERHRHSLGEIREIMDAMKNLAFTETHKLSRRLSAQARVIATMEAAAQELLAFHPELLASSAPTREVLLLIGSERGFCGDFNEVLVKTATGSQLARAAAIVVIGARLAARLPAAAPVQDRLTGPSTLEEVPAILTRLMERLIGAPPNPGALRVTACYHRADGTLACDPLNLEARERGTTHHGFGPVLNLPPAELLAALTEHYLFARLHSIFYGSLMAENRRRMEQMDRAIQRIEHQSADLQRQANRLRQEEITEEIEMIVANAVVLQPAGPSVLDQ